MSVDLTRKQLFALLRILEDLRFYRNYPITLTRGENFTHTDVQDLIVQLRHTYLESPK